MIILKTNVIYQALMPDTQAEVEAAEELTQKKIVLAKIREFRSEKKDDLTEENYKEISDDEEIKNDAPDYENEWKKIKDLDIENEAVKFEIDTLAFVNQIGFDKKLSLGTKLKNVSGVSGPTTFQFQTN